MFRFPVTIETFFLLSRESKTALQQNEPQNQFQAVMVLAQLSAVTEQHLHALITKIKLPESRRGIQLFAP